jgi:hypothetical protein
MKDRGKVVTAKQLLIMLDTLQRRMCPDKQPGEKKWSSIVGEAISAGVVSCMMSGLSESTNLSKTLQDYVDALAYCSYAHAEGRQENLLYYLSDDVPSSESEKDPKEMADGSNKAQG